jgi:hypothetical protein
VTAHPGAFCSPAGAIDETNAGTSMVCSAGDKGGRARWRRNGPAPARNPRRRGRKSTAAGGTLPQVNTGIDPTKNPAPVPQPAAPRDPEPAPAATPRPEEPAEATPPTPEPAQATTLPPRSDQPLEPPNGAWDRDQGLMHFDGALGKLWNGLGDDRHLTVDGRPLGNVVKDLGEGITMDRHSSQHALDDLRRIRRQLPADSRPGQLIDSAIRRLDAPAKPLPDLPANTPRQLRTLAEELNAIPLVRRGGDIGMGAQDPYHPDDAVADIARRWSAGQMRAGQVESELRQIGRWGHESMEGHEEIRRALKNAMRDVQSWSRRPR